MVKKVGDTRRHISPIVRAAFLNALDFIEDNRGKTFSQLIVEAIDEHGLMFVMDRVAKYAERTGELKVEHTGESLVGILERIGRQHHTEVEAEPQPVRH